MKIFQLLVPYSSDGIGEALASARVRDSFSYTRRHIDFRDFKGWWNAARNVRDSDEARNVLYYGFQPLYDNLIDARDRLTDSQKPLALKALDTLVQTSTQYLTDYYLGKPDVGLIHTQVQQIEPLVNEIGKVTFKLKDRNIDSNGISPKGIHTFLTHFLTAVKEDKVPLPDYIIGCACGSSEVAMSLAGITGAKVGFIRRSHRRGDTEPRVITEHDVLFRKELAGRNVLCVEDYVCSGGSLQKVMQKTATYTPQSVFGASVNFVGSGSYITKIASSHKFNLYSYGS